MQDVFKKNTDQKLLTFRECAIFLGLKESRLRYAVRHKQVPFLKIGHLVMFDKQSLNIWVNELVKMPVCTSRQLIRHLARQISENRTKIRNWKKRILSNIEGVNSNENE